MAASIYGTLVLCQAFVEYSIVSYLILITIPGGIYYYPHFITKGIGAKRGYTANKWLS